ncbi:uncharacterized protein DUF4178 [Chthoniobacter flavus]|uniref:DUF4178 domain-containing protein n=1 Tax=Chthoniobacter flavus TaxID=191863 RepID=UPI001046FCAF|nr:DUF4178 domain-containing protein [Chthoniobacter flavus]TCO88811.1 uncharacterized protein DUF4178 [Chthoniobacter flavus]
MSERVLDCPQCGAPVKLRSAAAVFAVCEHCRSMVVVKGASAEAIGEMAVLPPDLSPFQVGTRGEWKGRGFEIVGRVRVEWAEGSWNEWCILYDATITGWLAEAQGFLMVSFATEIDHPLSTDVRDYVAGKQLQINGQRWTVNDVKQVTCRASEGELPMAATPASKRLSVDLFSSHSGFASIELTDSGAEIYIGEYADFDALKFANLRPVPGWNAEVAQEKNQTTALSCPSCGAPVQLRAVGLSMSVVCGSCAVVIDTSKPECKIIQRADLANRSLAPLLPLGQRGKLFDVDYEVIGFVKREDRTSSWSEFLLFNPWQGFRWLVTYQGHWSFIERVPALADVQANVVECEGRDYKFYTKGTANVAGVLGEFYWKVQRGERADVFDYIAPPYILSKEVYPGLNEFTWSRGKYVEPAVIARAFGLAKPTLPVDIYLNQPNPYYESWRDIRWVAFAALLLLLFLQVRASRGHPEISVANERFIFQKVTASPKPPPTDPTSPDIANSTPADPAKTFTTPHFTLAGGEQRVDIDAAADVDNNWIDLDLRLVNVNTNASFPAFVELSYYHGSDEDGPWSEGSYSSSVSIPSVPPGEYFLSVEPSVDTQTTRVPFSVIVRSGGVFASNFIVMLLCVLFYPAMLFWRRHTFEAERWSEADGGYPWQRND